MSALPVENPIKESVSISCTACVFQDFGPFPRVESIAHRHATDLNHKVVLYLGLIPAGVWENGKFRSFSREERLTVKRGVPPCSATL